MIQIDDIKILHMTKAFGIDQIPEFSWKIVSDKNNVIQTAYQIVVSLDTQVVWDSGKIESNVQSFIEYEGQELLSRGIYNCKITVWDRDGEVAAGTSTFETAFMSKDDWSAKWIQSTLERKPVEKNKYGEAHTPVMFEREFSINDDARIVKARLYASAYGAYELKVNGEKADSREFAPEFTVYNSILYYQTYDVTDLLLKGENTISMYVADGWYFSGQAGPAQKNVLKPTIIYQLEITFDNGRVSKVVSDGSEQVREDYIVYSDIFQGEKQDFTRNVAKQLVKSVDVINLDKEMLCAQPMPPVEVVKRISAVEIIHTPRGETIVDFGQVLCGRAIILIEEEAGKEISFEYFEILDENGNYINTMFAPQKDIVITGNSPILHEAKFTFHGFRYIKVSGLSEISLNTFTAIALSTKKENLATFECSDSRLNRLYQNIRWSQSNNMMSIPTDCPSREKAGWTGDILVYAKTALMNENMTPFLSSWLRNVVADQQDDGTVMITTPFANLYGSLLKQQCEEFGDDRPTGVAGWSDAIVWVPYTMYRVTGNKRILKDTYSGMEKWCDYIINTAQKKRGYEGFPEEYDKYLWNTGFHFGEWLIPSRGHVPGFDICKESSFYIAPFWGYKTLCMMSEICEVLGENENSKKYKDFAENTKHAIAMTLFKEDKLPKDLMGAYVVAFAFDLVPAEYYDIYKSRLIKLINDNGDCLDTGFLATPFLLDVLESLGDGELAKKILWQNKKPSWLYEVDNDATCIWEAWEADEAKHTGRFISFDHYAFGCVDDWFCRRICGIDSDVPGFSHIVINPLMDDKLEFCKRTFVSEAGKITVEWTQDSLKVAIPCNTTANVFWKGNEYEIGSGEYTW
ncbi:MAG: family 78 glycoside hydrolase catalytic domain [Pseudobutyrivibrio sp.]|nr:family 78 glycoside hydrolase catalytic domain [Pseudobutyrivibrio sp.]